VLPAWLAMWVPNVVLGAAGGLALFLRAAHGEGTLRLPSVLGRGRAGQTPAEGAQLRTAVQRRPQGSRIRLPLPRPSILDGYVASHYIRIFLLAFGGFLSLFYISTFIDLSDKLFKGTTTAGALASYLWFATPQFVYYIVPLSALIATLVTIGALTKTSELIVMKACGVSLYRISASLLFFAALAGAGLFIMEEKVLADANRKAESIRHVMRGGSPRTFDVLNRKWVVGRGGEIYHYVYFDPRSDELNELSIFRLSNETWRLRSRSFIRQAAYREPVAQSRGNGLKAAVWDGRHGWDREFGSTTEPHGYTRFEYREIGLEPPEYFETERPDSDRMSYTQLRRYILELETSGFHVVPHAVALNRKVAFPFVTFIMTLIAIPFGVTTGRRGAMYGIGLGIVLAIVYWVATSIFAAIGSGGLLAPVLSAWAPNILFGSLALYLILTART
jgi:LPS export ABC transporter permease LptG